MMMTMMTFMTMTAMMTMMAKMTMMMTMMITMMTIMIMIMMINQFPISLSSSHPIPNNGLYFWEIKNVNYLVCKVDIDIVSSWTSQWLHSPPCPNSVTCIQLLRQTRSTIISSEKIWHSKIECQISNNINHHDCKKLLKIEYQISNTYFHPTRLWMKIIYSNIKFQILSIITTLDESKITGPKISQFLVALAALRL